MGLRSWWRAQPAAPTAADPARVPHDVPTLEPVIAAERRRGNETVDQWIQTSFGGPSGVEWKRQMRYPLDEEALRAEFDLDGRYVMLTDGVVSSWEDLAVLSGGKVPRQKAEMAAWHLAREQWWAAWRADPQTPRRLGRG